MSDTPRTDEAIRISQEEGLSILCGVNAVHMQALERELAKVTAERDRFENERNNWEQTAAQFSRNSDFYQGIVRYIGNLFGVHARTQDDGGVVEDVLALKVYPLVDQLRQRAEKAEAELAAEKLQSAEWFNECDTARNQRDDAKQQLAEAQHSKVVECQAMMEERDNALIQLAESRAACASKDEALQEKCRAYDITANLLAEAREDSEMLKSLLSEFVESVKQRAYSPNFEDMGGLVIAAEKAMQKGAE